MKNAGCPTHNIKALKAVVIYAINYNWEEPISQPVRPTWQLLSVIRSLQPTYVKPGRLAFQSPKKLPDFLLIFRFFEIVGFLFYFVCLLISRLISKSVSFEQFKFFILLPYHTAFNININLLLYSKVHDHNTAVSTSCLYCFPPCQQPIYLYFYLSMKQIAS